MKKPNDPEVLGIAEDPEVALKKKIMEEMKAEKAKKKLERGHSASSSSSDDSSSSDSSSSSSSESSEEEEVKKKKRKKVGSFLKWDYMKRLVVAWKLLDLLKFKIKSNILSNYRT